LPEPVKSGRLDWLIARPLAHRGLHDSEVNIVENTPSAFAAAVAARYGIECDVQVSADGEAIVHHDAMLGRLTDGTARLDSMSAAALKRVSFKNTHDHMMTLGELCDLVAARVALLVELKSGAEGNQRLVRRVADTLTRYAGPAAAMSFDPTQVAGLRTLAPVLPRGMAVQGASGGQMMGWFAHQGAVTYLKRAARAWPQFLAYSVDDLPALLPATARRFFQLPLLAWTVRTAEQRQRAARYSDQIIFEGFRP
jgi:glycerophosphoryl diester phosphodiesterase